MPDRELVHCPTCKAPNDCHEDVEAPPRRPSAGDVGICFSCLTPYTFTVSDAGVLGARRPTEEEAAEINADPRVARARGAIVATGDAHKAVRRARRG